MSAPTFALSRAFSKVGRSAEFAVSALRDFRQAEIRLYRRAWHDDPGLPEAVRQARAADPEIGWLDVALLRAEAK